MKELVINKNDSNQRIDKFLKKAFPNLSTAQIYKYLRIKRIKVNDKKVDNNYSLKLNDHIKLYINDEYLEKSSKNDWLIAKKPINIVYEDNNILIVNKPVGLVVHEDESNVADTLINRIIFYLYSKGEYDYKNENSFAPALVNRIDRNTSGIVLAAKNAESLRILNEKIKSREIKKYYLAKVHGIIDPKQGTLRDYLTKDSKNKLVKITKKPLNKDSKEIITKYKTISHDKVSSLIEVELITGRTHQIRAHMAYIGHPLIGERKYTSNEFSHSKNQYQSLSAYKVEFSFKSDAEILNYLRDKVFKI